MGFYDALIALALCALGYMLGRQSREFHHVELHRRLEAVMTSVECDAEFTPTVPFVASNTVKLVHAIRGSDTPPYDHNGDA